MEQWANHCMESSGLTAVQAYILQYILGHSQTGTSLTAIHRELGYSMAALSGMIKRLREKGYIHAECCEGDDRCKLLFVTPKGEENRQKLEHQIQTIQSQLYACLSPDELITLDHLQKKLLQNLSTLTDHTPKEVSEP
ncbi:MAG: MarR family winged helix-turn-helix transcriptional regulator [Eubacteriales bacterium]